MLRAVIALAALYGFLASVSHVYLDHLGDSLSEIEDLALGAAETRVSCDHAFSKYAAIQEHDQHTPGHSHDGDDHAHPLLCHRGKEDSGFALVLNSGACGGAYLALIDATTGNNGTFAHDGNVPPKVAGPHYILHRSLLI